MPARNSRHIFMRARHPVTVRPDSDQKAPSRLLLHLGAHRTGSTNLQSCLHQNRESLSAAGIGYWGPAVLRQGRLPGLYKSFNPGVDPEAQALETREIIAANREILRVRLANQQKYGHQTLIVSDENLLGDMQLNLARGALYKNAEARLALVAGVFGTGVAKIALGIRAQETYWPSLMAYRIARGAAAPGPEKLAALASQTRGWRHVVRALRQHFPKSEILVYNFEGFAARPDLLIGQLAGGTAILPDLAHSPHKNRAPDRATLFAKASARGDDLSARLIGDVAAAYQPFNTAQRQQLAQQFRADLAWLAQECGQGITYLPPYFG